MKCQKSQMFSLTSYLLIFLIVSITYCRQDDRKEDNLYENYGDIYSDDLSLATTSDNHPHGYARSNCWLCHNAQNIHQVDRIMTLDVDLNEIQNQISEQGLSSCSTCHGDNGLKD